MMHIWCKGNLGVPLIPKVAGNSIGRVLDDAGWEPYADTKLSLKEMKFYSVIREPVSRWISAVATYYTLALDLPAATPDQRWHKEAILNPRLTEWYVMKPTHENDGHTIPQCDFLDLLPNVQLFRMENIMDMWEALGIDTPNVHANLYTEWPNPDRAEVYDYLKKVMFRTPHYQQVIRDRYARDGELYLLA